MARFDRYEPQAFAALRIISGFMFALHGLPKLFGIFGGKVPVGGQLWAGGLIELVAGALIMVGCFTRPAALLASGTMAVAYWQFHVGRSGEILPIVNQGDASVLYCFVFLVFAIRGAGLWSLDRARGRA